MTEQTPPHDEWKIYHPDLGKRTVGITFYREGHQQRTIARDVQPEDAEEICTAHNTRNDLEAKADALTKERDDFRAYSEQTEQDWHEAVQQADAAYRALEDVYDAWIASDVHNRCAPGECVQCDKTYAVYAAALQSYKQSDRQ